MFRKPDNQFLNLEAALRVPNTNSPVDLFFGAQTYIQEIACVLTPHQLKS